MDYKPGGYSWLAVAPESTVEQQIEEIEDQIYVFRVEFEKSGNKKLLQEIQKLEEKIDKLHNLAQQKK